MADTAQTLALIAGALSQDFRDRVVRTINRRAVLLRLLRVEPGKGKNEAWDLEGDGAIAETFGDGDDVTNTGTDTVISAVLTRARYRSTFRITGDAMDAASTSTSPGELMRPVMRNIDNSLLKTASVMNADLYAGGGGNAFVGLATAIHDSNTYATIDRSQAGNAGFRSSVIDPGSPTDISIDALRRDIGDTIYTAGGETPDLAVCKPSVWYSIASKFDPNRRWEQETQVQMNNGIVTKLDGSVGAITIDGCTFIKDKDCTANSIIYLNTRYVEVLVWAQAMDALLPGAQQMPDQSLNDGDGVMPFGMKVYELARNGDSRRVCMQLKPQLIVRKPIACGKRLNVRATS